jgi:hypothetical protein
MLTKDSGTTGMPKGVPFNMDRGFQAGASVPFSLDFEFIEIRTDFY